MVAYTEEAVALVEVKTKLTFRAIQQARTRPSMLECAPNCDNYHFFKLN